MSDAINYNHRHRHSGFVISGSGDGRLTVGELRDAIAEFPDDAEVIFGTCSHGEPQHFYRFKTRGEKLLAIELS